jgi:glycosyltransferase involved in cell wall biosynthesis
MISIAMTTYNGEKFLKEQLDSILSQTYNDFELIICDDCSTDSTPVFLREYEKSDKRIKCFFNECNLGFLKNFEKAIKQLLFLETRSVCINSYTLLYFYSFFNFFINQSIYFRF